MYPERSVYSFLSTTMEYSGIYVKLRFSMDFSGLLGLCAKDAKGTARKATTIKANIFFIIHFLLFIVMLETPPGFANLKKL